MAVRKVILSMPRAISSGHDAKRLLRPEDLAVNPHKKPLYTYDEVKTLLAHATRFERTILLLALNLGASHAELISLQRDEIIESAKVERYRRKTGVYAEWPLWQATQDAVRWFVRQHRGGDGPELLLTRTGQRYQRQRIANMWWVLLRRVQKHQPDFRVLPFKQIRKSSSQFIQEVAGGEVASVFLAHRNRANDALLDAYTNRPFDKVAEALQVVEVNLGLASAAA